MLSNISLLKHTELLRYYNTRRHDDTTTHQSLLLLIYDTLQPTQRYTSQNPH